MALRGEDQTGRADHEQAIIRTGDWHCVFKCNGHGNASAVLSTCMCAALRKQVCAFANRHTKITWNNSFSKFFA